MTTSGSAPITQPPFDPRIQTLVFPLSGGQYGTLKRGFMVWETASGTPYSSEPQLNFLYNPSTVSADFYSSASSVASAYLFPTAFNATNLRVPLNQSVQWSLLFDRTYELWGGYDSEGLPQQSIGSGQNNPSTVGVLADIRQMYQFTGMDIAYSSGNTTTTSPSSGALAGNQGIMQLIPSYVYFGDSNNLWFYGYVSEWDFTVTHWTQYMVPMRCVMNVTFTMLPPPTQGAGSSANPGLGAGPGGPSSVTSPGTQVPLPTTTVPGPGVSGT
jgi:hypothetical protein